MFNFQIHFDYPWLLLLLIPAIALALIPYFRISKKYRRTRNRIVSLTLHILVMVFTISLLAGICFFFDVNNSGNEILLVVDASYSTREEEEAKNEYINDVIALSDPAVFKIGIVTFGYTQEYAAPLTNDYTNLFSDYIEAPLPDTSATDIAAALTYAKGLFEKPETAKIVLISDGIETDEIALAVIRGLTADGTRINTVRTSTLKPENEVQIVGVELPDYNVLENEEFPVKVTIKSACSSNTPVTVSMTDNGDESGEVVAEVSSGTQTLTIPHSLKGTGLHSLNFTVRTQSDEVSENNSFYSYMYLETFDKVLVIESRTNQSEKLSEILSGSGLNVTVKDILDESLPKTLNALREYDEIILNNIANSDLEKVEGFDRVLSDYVYVAGGGLFTVGGGEDGQPEKAHAYNRQDMTGKLYQQMLPVQAIDYTPPLGLIIVIDVSGSMSAQSSGGVSRLDAAKNSARSIIRDETCLSERDFCGILTLSDTYSEETRLLPLTRQDEILDAVNRVSGGGGTTFTPSIERAGYDLRNLYASGRIEKMHTIIISDGAAADYNDYLDRVKYYNGLGVTFSFVAVDADENSMGQLESAAEAGGGRAIRSTAADLTEKLREDIRVPAIQEVEYGEFTPQINNDSYYATVIKQEEMPVLEGFYGTRARANAEVVLSGQYNVPIFAQWKYGAGTVGSFMCDLNGVWSSDFVSDEPGQRLIISIVKKLFPTENIRPKDIDAPLREDNYTTQFNIFRTRDLQDNERIEVEVINRDNPNLEIKVTQPSETDGFSRCSFVTPAPGTYEIIIKWFNTENPDKPVSTLILYKSFSYSAEFDVLADNDGGVTLMNEIARYGNGVSCDISEAEAFDVFDGFVTTLHRTYDPRLAFMIIAIVLFLLDIAVRKFKFKWPHEIIKEFREKKNGK